MNARTAFDIAHAAPALAEHSPEHKRFRSLLKRIDEARQRLEAWQQQLPQFAALHAQHVQPIERRLNATRRAWAFELEQLLLRERWSLAQQDTLQRMIAMLAGRLLLTAGGPDAESDAELVALYERHEDPEVLDEPAPRARVHRAAREGSREEEAEAEPGAEAEPPHARPHGAAQPRAHRTRAEKRALAEAAQATQSVREVYRKLAAALHPDRISPDATAAERAARTELMARANAAYASDDLLALLALQLQIEQVDLTRAGQMAAGQLRHFNRVLNEQLREIEIDIAEREHLFCATYGVMPQRRLDPEKLAPFLKRGAENLLADEQQLRQQRRLLLGDTRIAKQVLKQIQAEFRLFDRFDEGMF